MKNLAIKATVIALGIGLSGSAQAVTFQDTTFNFGDYAASGFTQNYNNGASTVFATGQTPNGNPGTAFESAISVSPGVLDVLVTAVNSTFVYNPSMSGAITSLDTSLDRYTAVASGSLTYRILIAQDAKLYEYVATYPGQAAGVWASLTGNGLTANDFGLFSPTNLSGADLSMHPDFSASGSAINFGFAMRRGPATVTDVYNDVLRADNFRVTVNAVPEPATWAMMIVGFGMVGGLARRRRRLAIA